MPCSGTVREGPTTAIVAGMPPLFSNSRMVSFMHFLFSVQFSTMINASVKWHSFL